MAFFSETGDEVFTLNPDDNLLGDTDSTMDISNGSIGIKWHNESELDFSYVTSSVDSIITMTGANNGIYKITKT